MRQKQAFVKADSQEQSDRFVKLSTYNSEKARGVAHTRAWDEYMREIQAEFDDWNVRTL